MKPHSETENIVEMLNQEREESKAESCFFSDGSTELDIEKWQKFGAVNAYYPNTDCVIGEINSTIPNGWTSEIECIIEDSIMGDHKLRE